MSKNDMVIWKTHLSKKPCSYIEKILDQKRKDPQTTSSPDSDLLERYFRCGFKITFSGVLKRVFTGISSIKNYEITMIREYECEVDDFEDCRNYTNIFIVEFNFQVDTNQKIQNGRVLKESINEAMIALRKETSLIINPRKTQQPKKNPKEKRNDENTRNTERVQFLKNPGKAKKFGQFVIPFTAGTLTLLILFYL